MEEFDVLYYVVGCVRVFRLVNAEVLTLASGFLRITQ